MPATYEKIATTTLGSNGTISFTSIPSTYTDLTLILNSFSGTTSQMTFNSDSSSLYSQTWVSGNGTAASSSRSTTQTQFTSNNIGSSTIPFLYIYDIFSYASSTNKTFLVSESSDKNGSGNSVRYVGLYRSTTAISSIQLLNTMNSGTTATLYGILKA